MAFNFAVVYLESSVGEAAPPALLLVDGIDNRFVDDRPGYGIAFELANPSVQLVEHGNRLFLSSGVASLGRKAIGLARFFYVVDFREVRERDRPAGISGGGRLFEFPPDVHSAPEAPALVGLGCFSFRRFQ